MGRLLEHGPCQQSTSHSNLLTCTAPVYLPQEDPERVRRKKRPAVWQLVKENTYTHRQRKEQDEDDIMICQCRRPTDGSPGCGPDCLNRLLNIECVPVSSCYGAARRATCA